MNETGYLFRERREENQPHQDDVKVVYSKDIDTSVDFEVKIVDGRKDAYGRVLIYPHYALFYSFENPGRNPNSLGAEIVATPPIEPIGRFFRVRDRLIIRLIP